MEDNNLFYKISSLFIIFVLISACGKIAPKCSDQETQDTLQQLTKNMIIESFGKELANESFGKELAKNISISLSAIRTTDYSEKTGSQDCAAKIKMVFLSKEKLIDITYKTELMDIGDQFLVTINEFHIPDIPVYQFMSLQIEKNEKYLNGAILAVFTSLDSITDVDSAKSAIPSLTEATGQLSNLGGLFAKLPEAARGPMTTIVADNMQGIQDVITKVAGIPGVGELIKPVVEKLSDALLMFK